MSRKDLTKSQLDLVYGSESVEDSRSLSGVYSEQEQQRWVTYLAAVTTVLWCMSHDLLFARIPG